jgi:hypothetical protein
MDAAVHKKKRGRPPLPPEQRKRSSTRVVVDAILIEVKQIRKSIEAIEARLMKLDGR